VFAVSAVETKQDELKTGRQTPAKGSVSILLSQLKAGDDEAVRLLWNRYSSALIGSARKQFHGQNPARLDPDELAQSVFNALYRGAIDNRFDRLNDRTGFWTIVLMLTKRKAIDRIRRETRLKRGGAGNSDLSAEGHGSDVSHPDMSELADDVLQPDVIAESDDAFQHLLELLDAEDSTGFLKNVAVWRMAGYTVKEIAHTNSRAERTIERKLERIRAVWTPWIESQAIED